MPPPPEDAATPLYATFVAPADDARPRVWWHWMDGNVDIEGIERDVDWLHAVGVGGVQIFDGGMGLTPVVAHPARPGTSQWDGAIAAAVSRSRQLGLEVAVATSSGWSASGGPWVEPRDAMKKVVWSTISIESAGNGVAPALPPLPTAIGAYQDEGAEDSDRGLAVDWRIVAFPSDDAHTPLGSAEMITSTGSTPPNDILVDGSFATSISLPRAAEAFSSAWIEQRFATDVDVRSVVVGLPSPRGFGAAPPPRAVLDAQAEDGSWFTVVELVDSRAPVRSASFPAVRARAFRLCLSGDAAINALPPMANGVAVPPVIRPAHAFEISEFALFPAARVHTAEAKAGFGIVPDYYALDSPSADAGVIDPRSVIDLTGRIRDEKLDWEPPPGRWTILRMGASLTGATNGPAMDDATGLEVDKLDRGRVAAYLEQHLSRFAGAAGGNLSAIVSDSIEAGLQNWTDEIASHFQGRRGYDPTPWLPCLTGWVVGDASSADRFLYDYRRTVAELIADHYYGTLARVAHERGLTLYAEALEDGRPQLGDDLAMRSHADVPMGAMWTFSPEQGPRPTYVADLRGAASVAHVHGASHAGCEAFTSFEDPWASTPGALKHVADLQFALGATRLCIHSSPHQPSSVPPPGMALAPFLGQVFSRHETWASMARPWVDYLARCSALMASGRPVVDIAVFVGEEAPVTGLFSESVDSSVPAGLGFDYVGPDALADILDVSDGRITARAADYRLLFLGGTSDRMTTESLRHVARLLDAGATVVGLAPEQSPSLADDHGTWSRLRDSIWGAGRSPRLIETTDLADALDRLKVRPPAHIADRAVLTASRRIDGSLVTFVANPTAAHIETTVTWREPTSRAARWDPVTTARSALPSAPPSGDEGPRFTLSLAPFESAFLLADVAAPASAAPSRRRELRGRWLTSLPGYDTWRTDGGPSLWTEDARAPGFSGIGTYSTRFALSDDDTRAARIVLTFEEVRDIAEVIVNGVSAGVAWTPPYRVDITDVTVPGWNDLEVRVANPWRNRLIAEAAEPSGRMYLPMTRVFMPDAEPRAAGLGGSVSLTFEDPAPNQPDYSHA